MSKFDPEATFSKDSSIFGMPKDINSNLLLLPVAWEVTTSFRRGTLNGPQSLFDATKQMDLYHPYWREVYERGISWDENFLKETQKLNNQVSEFALRVISSLEKDVEPDHQDIEKTNIGSHNFNELVYKTCVDENKKIGIVGGDHSSPFGLIKVLSEKYKGDFSIVHLDAHFDLRNAYQGFIHSHASIMKNVLDLKNAPKIFQMGLRDFSKSEFILAQEKTNFLLDIEFQNLKLKGKNLENILDSFFEKLSKKIYISFDIDGLAPEFCPSTGTPVPGGFTYSEAVFLIQYLHKRGHELIGFDLVEVSPKSPESLGIDEILGARLLYELSCFALA